MILHEGAILAIKMAGELAHDGDIVEALVQGNLSGPAKFQTAWFWRARLTGTGLAVRPGKGIDGRDEFVYRPKEVWFHPQMMERSVGIPVIWEHPKGAVLNSKEFGTRIVGTVVKVFVHENEEDVDCIIRIYDAEAEQLLEEGKLSTSPTVVFGKNSGNTLVELDANSQFVIENEPLYVDHLAICEMGVWDVGGPPEGIRGDSVMAEEEMKEDKRSDSEKAADAKFDSFKKECMDAIADGFKAFGAKKDSEEKDDAKKGDEFPPKKEEKEEEEKDDATKSADAKKDGDLKIEHKDDVKKADEKEPPINDKGRADAKADAALKENAELKKLLASLSGKIDALQTKIPKQLSDEDHNAMAEIQSKADSVFNGFGKRAPRPLDGESRLQYRRRLAATLKTYSADWKEVDLAPFGEGKAFDTIESKIYADAISASANPVDLAEDEIREIKRNDPASGRTITEFKGRQTFIHQMARPRRIISGMGDPLTRRQS